MAATAAPRGVPWIDPGDRRVLHSHPSMMRQTPERDALLAQFNPALHPLHTGLDGIVSLAPGLVYRRHNQVFHLTDIWHIA